MSVKIAHFQSLAEACIDVINDDIGKLGTLLLQAKDELSAKEFEEFEMFLLNRFLTKADIKAAMMVAQGKLDKRLAFAGVKNSKILNMKPGEHKRLLSGEKFQLRQSDGSIEDKSWGEMTDAEKDQLLGSKGGIHMPHEQKTSRSATQESTIVFDTATYDRNRALVLSFGKRKGKIAAGAIVQALMEHGELDAFLADLNAIQKQVALVEA